MLNPDHPMIIQWSSARCTWSPWLLSQAPHPVACRSPFRPDGHRPRNGPPDWAVLCILRAFNFKKWGIKCVNHFAPQSHPDFRIGNSLHRGIFNVLFVGSFSKGICPCRQRLGVYIYIYIYICDIMECPQWYIYILYYIYIYVIVHLYITNWGKSIYDLVINMPMVRFLGKTDKKQGLWKKEMLEYWGWPPNLWVRRSQSLPCNFNIATENCHVQ